MNITKKNYFTEVNRIGFENLPEPLKKIHLVLMAKTDQGNDWTLYEKDKEFKNTIDIAFEKLTEFIKSNRKDLSGIAERNALMDGTYKLSQSLDGTDKPEMEMKLILRLLNMTGKIISKRELKNYIDDLQEAIRKKQIRKTSHHAEEIAYIQKSLLRIYNGMKRNIVVLQFKKETSKRLKTIALKARKKSHKTGKKTKTLKHVSLKGIPEKPVLNRVETIEKEVTSKADKHLMSSIDFAEMKFESLGFSQKWKDLMGDPSKGFTAMVYGKPKTGKSYLSVDFAGYLARHHGNTLYVAREEKLDATLHKKLQDKEVVHQNLFVSDFLPEDLSKYEFIFLDSVNKLGLSPQDIENLRTKNPGKSFIFIFQTTKQGQFRGRNEFQHDVDVVIEVPERGKAVQFGRFNQGGEMDIFDEESDKNEDTTIVPPSLMGTGLSKKNEGTHKYIIDLNERGSFRAHVENSNGKVIYEFASGNELQEGETSIFEDGFMKDDTDIDGLEKYLKELKILKFDDRIISEEDLSGKKKEKGITKRKRMNLRVSKKSVTVAKTKNDNSMVNMNRLSSETKKEVKTMIDNLSEVINHYKNEKNPNWGTVGTLANIHESLGSHLYDSYEKHLGYSKTVQEGIKRHSEAALELLSMISGDVEKYSEKEHHSQLVNLKHFLSDLLEGFTAILPKLKTKSLIQKDEKFYYHSMMAGYYEIQEKKLWDTISDFNSSSDPGLRKAAESMEKEREKMSYKAEFHLKKKKELYKEKNHGHWNDTIPTEEEARIYGEEFLKGSANQSTPTKTSSLREEAIKIAMKLGDKELVKYLENAPLKAIQRRIRALREDAEEGRKRQK